MCDDRRIDAWVDDREKHAIYYCDALEDLLLKFPLHPLNMRPKVQAALRHIRMCFALLGEQYPNNGTATQSTTKTDRS